VAQVSSPTPSRLTPPTVTKILTRISAGHLPPGHIRVRACRSESATHESVHARHSQPSGWSVIRLQVPCCRNKCSAAQLQAFAAGRSVAWMIANYTGDGTGPPGPGPGAADQCTAPCPSRSHHPALNSHHIDRDAATQHRTRAASAQLSRLPPCGAGSAANQVGAIMMAPDSHRPSCSSPLPVGQPGTRLVQPNSTTLRLVPPRAGFEGTCLI
jgi:hypothetical protein